MDPIFIVLVGIAVVLGGILVFRLHAFLALILGALVIGILTTPDTLMQYAKGKGMTANEVSALLNLSLGRRVAQAFGNTAAKVGLLIAMASVIGSCLLKSGAADRIVRSFLRLMGEKRSDLAFLGSGFLLAIPVYFDTVFYLLMPLGKSMGIRFPTKYGLFIMAIVAGGVMAHSLVPPTPGPLFVAEELGVDIGLMMIGGLIVGVFTTGAGYLYAIWINKRQSLPLRDTPDTTLDQMKAVSEKSLSELPSLWGSLLPIILPVLLISGNTIMGLMPAPVGEGNAGLQTVLQLLGDPVIALTISAMFALLLLWRKVADSEEFGPAIQEALFSAGMIILITSAGGALGGMLQQTGISFRIEQLAAHFQFALIPFAFLITALVRIAQGSATVSMITTVGVLSGIASSGTLAFHPLYLALAIGCGSKLIPWMNDSGFWIVTQMSGMEVKETFRYFSFLLALMGCAGLLTIMVMAHFFPLV